MKPIRTRNHFSGAVEHLEPRTMLTGAPELVRDINLQIEQAEIGQLMPMGDSSLFLKDHELWITDGTSEGTRIVRDVSPAMDTSVNFPIPSVSRHQIVGDRLYFVKENPHYDRLWSSIGSQILHFDELWVTDGTEDGTVRLSKGLGEVRDLVELEGQLFFTSSLENRTSLWQTDGPHATQVSVPGSGNVRAIAKFQDQLAVATNEAVWTLVGDQYSKLLEIPYVDSILSMSDGLYVTTSHELPGQREVVVEILWSDLTDSVSTKLYESVARQNQASDLFVSGEQVFFETYGCSSSCSSQIWASDRTEGGGIKVASDVAPGSTTSAGGQILYAKNDTVYVLSVSGGEVSSVPLANRQPQGVPIASAALGGNTFFVATDRESGTELHVANPVSGETLLFLDLAEGSGSSQPRDLTVRDEKLFFVTTIGNKSQLWESGGTVDTTMLRGELDSIEEYGFIGEDLLVVGNRDVEDRRLWASDGAELSALTNVGDKTVGSVDLEVCAFSQCSPEFSFLGVLDEFAYFYADDGDRTSLWKTDGTEHGTIKAADERLRHRHHYDAGRAHEALPLGTQLFFAQELHDPQLTVVWALDLAIGESNRLLEVTGSAQMLGSVNDQMIFSTRGADDATVWTSDGTVEGTAAIAVADVASSTPVATFAGELYFAARNEEHGKELWKSDGTAEGTNLVADLFAGPGSSDPTELMVLGDRLLFAADDGEHGHELWSIRADERLPTIPDITLTSPEVASVAAGSYQPLADVDLENYRQLFLERGELYFTVSVGDAPQVWKTDGTPVGTEYALTLPTDDVYRLGDYPRDATSLATNTREFYIGNRSYELWANDGKSVYQVIDLEETENYISSLLIATNSHAFFGTRGRQGDQLWSTDGTDDGTQLIAETFVGGDSVVLLGDLVYFTVTDHDSSSTELWVSDGSEAGTFVVDQLTGEAWSVTAVNGSLIVGRTSEIGRDAPWVYRPAILGDLDRDDDVDFADFLALSANFGANQASRQHGDINGDNVVDFSDFLLFAKYFGSDESGHELIDAALDQQR